MSAGHQSGRLRRLHSRTKSAKHGLSQFISGRSASFQSLQLVAEGEHGDCTAALSKEWQALTPRATSNSAPVSPSCLGGLLDGIAELSTSAETHGSGGSQRSGCSFFSGRQTTGDQKASDPGHHDSDFQVVPVLRGDMARLPAQHTTARSHDTSLQSCGWHVPVERSNSMDSCSGSLVKQH